ncbi:MAG: hypothetical protein F6K36_25260 [Symploca sp. SIO3C6]|uniref:Uncharacterized protein n=1 Tax=Symploca sp. SIO1C4 TaxID=2607765 RepID=A0A6B3NAA6_9CYAN|nr:hypothetical protein [Symploca sp. SIO3C6]NER28443.1 hypothetical protein [Symploca sp. SIO1C4]NET06349.1 hypothetical protein [Symploca sp. SIO2B6]NET51308.1 hypothetical protein [Merismopedia sp. SIO2A8]
MSKYCFHDEITLAEEAEKLGKKAIKLGLINGFTVHLFPDCWQFYIPNEQESEPLSSEEVYLRFKKLVEQSGT